MFDYRKFCLETYTFILQTWPWAQISETVHRMLGHSWQFIVLNYNQGLLSQAESGSEATHKVERRTREHGARKVSLMKGNEDTFR